jgi:hypothetical protein
MTVVKAFAAVLTALAALILGATAAAATPYVSGATCSVTDGTPAVGGRDTVNCTDFGGHDTVQFTLHSATYPLGSAVTDADGAVTIDITLPDGVDGKHQIRAFDPTTNQLASVDINIGGTGTGGEENGGGGGPTAITGVAIFGLGGLGVLLVVGGALVLLAGRRKANA